MAGTQATVPQTGRASRPRVLAETARRALLLWPRLERRALARCAGDPACIANHVSRRTSLPPHIVRAMISPGLTDADGEFWFG